MSSENSVSELEAKFDAILGQILARRGKRRQKHVAELKSFFSNVLKELGETNFYKNLEIGNLELEINSLKK